MQPHPQYSFVVTSRNDSHGGNILKRMRLFVSGLIHQANAFRMPIELIFVEWNPPADRPPLHQVLPKPGPNDMLRLRYITVPPAIHQRFRRHIEIPLFQMIAKNVGIRRATSPWILATNIDLIFSDPLCATMARQDLDPQCFYRANRVDIPDGIDESMTLAQQLEWAAQHVIRINGWDARYRYVDVRTHGMKEVGPISRRITDYIGRRHRMRQPLGEREYYLLDRMACGDFTLMHRDAWMAIHGYLELDLYSIHVDTLGIVAARAAGYTQVVFPSEACTYHIDHPAGWSALDTVAKLKFLEERPGIDHSVMLEVAKEMLELRKPLRLNPPDWGFANEHFQEISF